MKMKKLLTLFLASLIALSSVSLYGCKKDDFQKHEHKFGEAKYWLWDIEVGEAHLVYDCKDCEYVGSKKTAVSKTNKIVSASNDDFTISVGGSDNYYAKVEINKKTFESNANVVTVHTDEQNAYLRANYADILDFTRGNRELSKPKGIRLEWTYEGEAESFNVKVLKDGKVVAKKDTTENFVEIYNLEIGRDYVWNVSAVKDGVTKTSPNGTFSVSSDYPRNLSIHAVTNVRDIGGYLTENGGRIKQGVIYRSARLDSLADEKHVEGVNQLLDLKIKTEIDLRGGYNDSNILKDPLGDRLNYLFYGMTTGEIISNEDNLESIKSIFEAFSNEDNYPLLFHCSIGTDRTGGIAFLLNGLLGVPEETLYYDYLFSCFGNIGGTRAPQVIEGYIEKVRESGGKNDSLSRCIYKYLNEEIGVSKEDLDSIIKNLTE